MKAFTAQQLAPMMEGTLIQGDPGLTVTGVSTDTRTITKDQVFFALQGEKSDGHAYLEKAREAGCRMAVVSKDVSLPEDTAVIRVEDTLKALQALAKNYLKQFPELKKVGVTGSTGKTSTKELLYWCLCGEYRTARNIKNLNNHIGMPLTALSVEEEHQAAIFEMGMGDFGEVDLLADIARPQMAILTNIGVSHISVLGSRENILKAKMEITNYFDKDSVLVVNIDNDLLSQENWEEKEYRVVKVGRAPGSDYRIRDILDRGEEGVTLTLDFAGEEHVFDIPIPGVHNGYNGALAVAAACELGVAPAQIAVTIAQCEHTDQRLVINTSPVGVKVIDDSYNASPDSMKAGIDVLMRAEGERKVVILADMLGMGPETEKYHREVGDYAGEKGVDLVLTTGKDAVFIADSAARRLGEDRIYYFPTRDEMIGKLDEVIRPGDVVLVKASHALGMEKVVEYLLKDRS
jgi:UDP-N-acetylmuramoyl-tripeptide--D-alanyl-D-alanine ligase